jgi:hypothetical protein
MSMIPARRGLSAFFKGRDGRPSREEEVHAFNDAGSAMILGDNGLVPARGFPDFAYVGDTMRDTYQYVSMIPGGGWMVRVFWSDDRTGESGTYDTPVVAWALTVSGSIKPLTYNHELAGLDEQSPGHAVWHPDHEDAPKEPAS